MFKRKKSMVVESDKDVIKPQLEIGTIYYLRTSAGIVDVECCSISHVKNEDSVYVPKYNLRPIDDYRSNYWHIMEKDIGVLVFKTHQEAESYRPA